ncbi:ankyrin repeat-containing domain protein [Trichoderma ceciliae]
MDSRDDRNFHLVLVHSTTDWQQSRTDAENFWSARFPTASVISIEFLDKNAPWGDTGLAERALDLLRKVEKCTISKVFYDTPGPKESAPLWHHDVLRLLSASDLGSCPPASLLKELPTALNEVSWKFVGIETYYNILNIQSKEEACKSIWSFAIGDKTTERISNKISLAVEQKLRTASQELSTFFQTLSAIDTNNYQLQLHEFSTNSIQWVIQHPSYGTWEAVRPDAPNILYMHGFHRYGSAVIASSLFFKLQQQQATDRPVIATFSFSKHDIRTQRIEALYTSLSRQLLLKDPLLFRRVSAITEAIQIDKIFSYQILRNLLRTIIQASMPKPIIFIIHGVQDSTGAFKIVVMDGEQRNDGFYQNTNSCCIDLGEIGHSIPFLEAYAKEKTGTIVNNNPQLGYYRDTIFHILFSKPTDFADTALTATLLALETEGIPSTLRAAIDTLKGLPGTLQEKYERALEHCKRKCGLTLDPLLQWISHAVRPLTLGELAIVATLGVEQGVSLENVRHNMPNQIARDLHWVNGTLIRIADLQVVPIYQWMKSTPGESEDDSNFLIFSRCLDYLKSTIGCHDPKISFDKPEYDLLGYAVVEWPQHYMRTRQDLKTSRVLELFNNSYTIEAWFRLYKIHTGFSANRYSELNSKLKIACWFGLLDLAESAIKQALNTANFEAELSESLDLAAENGHKDIITLLLSAGARSQNAMSLAASAGFLNIIETLREAQPENIHLEDRFGKFPFVMSVMSGNDAISSYLLEKGAKCDVFTKSEKTPLHLAAEIGHTTTVQLLINKNISTEAKSDNGNDAFQMASAGGFDDIVTLLLGHCEVDRKNDAGMTALHLAIKHGHSSTIDILLDAGANIETRTDSGHSPIHLAAEAGFLSVLQKLIQRESAQVSTAVEEHTHGRGEDKTKGDRKDGEINKSGKVYTANNSKRDNTKENTNTEAQIDIKSPLQMAALNGHTKIVHELLHHERYSSDKDRAISLLLAAKEGFTEIVEKLLQSNVTIPHEDEDGNTALHLAVKGQYTDIIEQLLDMKYKTLGIFDIGAKNKSLKTPLHFAAEIGRLVTLQILLAKGAELDSLDESRRSVFHIAARYGHVHIFTELLKRVGSDVKRHSFISAPDASGTTPFILAVREGHLSITKLILDKFSSFKNELKSLQGQENALIVAVRKNNPELVKLLLVDGWDINENEKTTALHSAVTHGDAGLIDILLERGARPNALDSTYQSPLHLAIEQGVATLDALLQNKHNVVFGIDLVDNEGRTPLWQASWRGRKEAVGKLLELSPNLEISDNFGYTALHAAYDAPEITRLLLNAGANPMALTKDQKTPFILAADELNGAETIKHYANNTGLECDFNARNLNGQTALHIAAMGGTLDTVKLLSTSNAYIAASTNEGATALHYGASRGNLPIVRYLIELGLDINANSESMGTPLMSAAMENRSEVAEFLIEKGAKADVTNEKYNYHSALQTAAYSGAEQVVQDLLKAKASPNVFGGAYGSPLCAAIHSGNLNIARLLVKAGADINYSQGRKGTAIEYAIIRKDLPLVDLLYKHNADVNIPSKGKYGTPLIAAIHNDNINNVRELLEHGADPNLSSLIGEKPAQAALRKGRKDIFNILLEKGVQLAFKDNWGRGPLSTAILNRSFDLLPSLWGREDVNVNETDGVGRTPLILAAVQGIDMVEELRKRKAEMNVQDRWKKTALKYAIIHGYSIMASELIEHGADLMIQDIRGRDALYWASQRSSVFNQVFTKVLYHSSYNDCMQRAVSAAIALDEPELAKKLLEVIYLNYLQTDDDGWTMQETVSMYKNEAIKRLINTMAVRSRLVALVQAPNPVKIPTGWHPDDLSPALICSPDRRSLIVSNTVQSPNDFSQPVGLARADHPMWPQKDRVYYFEVTIDHEGTINDESKGSQRYAIGFCDERTALGGVQLGWQKKSWGYHGGDGKIFHPSISSEGSSPFGSAYGKGDVIGCGVNFEKDVAFYTLNGKIIGRAFCDIRGKLYPAVSVDVRMAECSFSARFWEGGPEGNKDFMFKGPFNDTKTFENPPVLWNEGGGSHRQDTLPYESSSDSS